MQQIAFNELVFSVKKRLLRMYFNANAGHVGSSLSCAELLCYIKFCCMQDEDRFILSKGHAAALLYSVLAEAGELSDTDIAGFYQNGTMLPAHPPVNKIKSIPFATGSLGHGLGLAAGLALSSKLRKDNRKVYCITSDGEINEGSTWEAALFIKAQNLNNLIWVIDRNRLQGFGLTEEIMPLEPLADKLKSFGFDVYNINGHHWQDFEIIRNDDSVFMPKVIIANTIKGNGWEDLQGQLACHYLPMTEQQYFDSLKKIENNSLHA